MIEKYATGGKVALEIAKIAWHGLTFPLAASDGSLVSDKTAQERYDSWHRSIKEPTKAESPLAFAWYHSVYSEISNQSPRSILEVGCGRGDFAIFLNSRFPNAKITGVDVSGAAIEIANSKLNKTLTGVHFLQANAESLPFSDALFDLVISCECIEHVADPQTMARELARVATVGAKICVTTENYLNGMLLARLHALVTRQPFDLDLACSRGKIYSFFGMCGDILRKLV